MNKFSAKALYITGMLVCFAGPVFTAIIARIFPDTQAIDIISFYYSTRALGAILFTLALAKKRIEKGEVLASSLFRALTPAQISLILSMLLLSVALILIGVYGYTSEYVSFPLLWLSGIGIIASVILAIKRMVNNRKRHFSSTGKNSVSTKPASVPVSVPLKQQDNLSDAVTDTASSQDQNSKVFSESNVTIEGTCYICSKKFDRDSMILVNDRFVCEKCLNSLYPISNSDEIDFENT